MQFSLSSQDIRLDSLINAALARLIRNTRNHKLTQSWWLLRQILYQLYWQNPFQLYLANPLNAWSQISQGALAAKVGLSREWTNKLIQRLKADGWIATEAPRKPDGTQERTTFRPGGKLKELLIGMQKSPHNTRVNSQLQLVPTALKEGGDKQTDRQTDTPIPPGLVDGYVKDLAGKLNLDTKLKW